MTTIRILFFLMIAGTTLQAQPYQGSELQIAISQAYQHLGAKELDKADSLGYSALRTLQNSDMTLDTAWVKLYHLLGTLENYKARYRVSVNFFKKALEFPLVKNNPSLKQAILNNLGSSQIYIGKFPEALKSFSEALKISEQMNDRESILGLWVNMADLEFELGHYKDAIELTQKALEEIESPLLLSYCHLNLGKYYNFDNQLDKSYQYTETALRGFTEQNDTYYIVASLINLSDIQRKLKNFPAAIQTMQKAMDMARANNFDKFIGTTLIHQCKNIILSGSNLSQARDYALEAIQLTRISGRREHMEEATLELARYFAAIGDMKAFANAMDEYNTIKEETIRLNANAAAEEFKAIYEQERLYAEIKALRQNIRFKNQQLLFGLLVLLTVTLTGSIILAQYTKLKQNMKTMFQMNVGLAYSRHSEDSIPESSESSSSDTEPDLSDLQLFKLILRKIEENELHKDPNFGLIDLARHMNRARSTVSKAINVAGKTNFTNLINSFKVNEARKLLLEKGSEMSIGSIVTEAGFSSRISFNRHFKELTGFTPSQYLQMSNQKVELEEGELAGDG